MTRQIPLLINGEIVKSTSGQTLPVLNPSTQELLGEVPFAARQEIETAVAGAKSAFSTLISQTAQKLLLHRRFSCFYHGMNMA